MERFAGAALQELGVFALDDVESADARADIDAARPAISGVIFRPDMRIAKSAAASASWMKRPIFFSSFFSMPMERIEIA